MTWVLGTTRPPEPRITASGRSLPEDSTSMSGKANWVIDRLPSSSSGSKSPGTNSLTVPDNRTSSPTSTDGAPPVNTKMPSDVAMSPSPSGSCT